MALILNSLAFGLMLIWLGWRSFVSWKAWRAGQLNPKNTLFIGLAWVGLIGLAARYILHTSIQTTL